MLQKASVRLRTCFSFACALTFSFAVAAPAHAQHAEELAKQPGVIFSRAMEDVPGKNLVVVRLDYPPNPPQEAKPPRPYLGHRHPGSTYVYVLKGAMRLGIEGQPVQIVREGESFFEPVGVLHTVAESASATEPASAIAVLIIPDGDPILTRVERPEQ